MEAQFTALHARAFEGIGRRTASRLPADYVSVQALLWHNGAEGDTLACT
jgi:hypothetical protein